MELRSVALTIYTKKFKNQNSNRIIDISHRVGMGSLPLRLPGDARLLRMELSNHGRSEFGPLLNRRMVDKKLMLFLLFEFLLNPKSGSIVQIYPLPEGQRKLVYPSHLLVNVAIQTAPSEQTEVLTKASPVSVI